MTVCAASLASVAALAAAATIAKRGSAADRTGEDRATLLLV